MLGKEQAGYKCFVSHPYIIQNVQCVPENAKPEDKMWYILFSNLSVFSSQFGLDLQIHWGSMVPFPC